MVTDTLRNIKAENLLVLVKISPAEDVLNFFPEEHCVVCEFKLSEVLESLCTHSPLSSDLRIALVSS